MIQMIGLIQPILIKIWNCIVGIIFYGLILGRHEFIFSYAQVHKYLTFSFGDHFIHSLPHKIIFVVIVDVGTV